MAKTVSITVHPPGATAEYLTVSDAMSQVLDMVSALENIEAGDEAERKIVWRLTAARTNSPPFTIVAEAFPKDPQVSVAIEAERVVRAYAAGLRGLLAGEKPVWLEDDACRDFRRALKRNLNGVGRTEVSIDGLKVVSIDPKAALQGVATLEIANLVEKEDNRRSEYGSIEGQVIGLTKYYSSPALIVQERLSGQKIVCPLSAKLADQIGPAHQWSDAWEGRFARIGGELVYGPEGKLKRINASSFEEIVWSDVSLNELREIDLLQGRTVQGHIDEFWGEKFG